MAMTHEQFAALVRRLEEYARREPGGYRLRVGLLAALGYVYLFVVLALVVALIGLLVLLMVSTSHGSYLIGKAGWVLVTLAAIIVRALWVRFPPPEGLELTRAEAPQLFQLVDELTASLQAPRFHHVLLTTDFNAAVVRVPRLGIFGWQRNHLALGLPLMQALSPDQLRAVLAHELGHLSGNHGRFGGWIYRVRKTWAQLIERLEQERHPGTAVFEWFLNWYVPFFNAYSFVLARADEYVADRCSAELAGAQNAAEPLIHVQIKGKFLESSFWPGVLKQADQQAEPPAAVFGPMSHALRSGLPAGEAARWLDQALTEKTDVDDTHPSLTDRLSALGYLPVAGGGRHPSLSDRLLALGYRPAPARADDRTEQPTDLPPPVGETAARHFLADAAESVTARLEREWREHVAPGWRQRYEYARQAQQGLHELEAKARSGTLTEEEAFNRARWTAEFRGNEAAVPLFQEFLDSHPDHAPAHFALGQILLKQNETAGITHIERAMEADLEAVLPGCQVVYAYLNQQGRAEEAERYRKRAEQHYELLVRAQQERATVSAGDRFEPHPLSAEAVEELRRQLSRYPQVGAALLVRKAVSCFPEKPLYVLGIVPHRPWYKPHSETSDHQLAQRLAAELQAPGQTRIIVFNRHTAGLKKLLRKAPGAEIYRR